MSKQRNQRTEFPFPLSPLPPVQIHVTSAATRFLVHARLSGGLFQVWPSRCSSSASHARAKVQCRLAVRSEMFNNSAISSLLRPTKKRSRTTSAAGGSTSASFSSASSRRSNVVSFASTATSTEFRSTCSTPPPRFSARLCRARSIRIRRIACAAAPKKCARFEKPGWPSPTSCSHAS